MGICSSCEATSVTTAKLVLQDGQLQEYSCPVKVSHVLQRNPSCFICNSDDMEFDDVVSAINDDEELQPGQLYFALPLSQLKHRLKAEEMAALAVKASSALMKGHVKSGCRKKNNVCPMMFSPKDDVISRRRTVAASGDTRMRSGGDGGGGDGGRKRRSFSIKLSSIPE
ncbi:PADRE domain [Dillenia turbinata]|uniref:PADRE domain n=1 Tax=Dillenia turbinata TaxID=194707 RepID=A0AAN8V0J4_9MAGN